MRLAILLMKRECNMTTRRFPFSPARKAERPLPDRKEDWAWINEHQGELSGQWVVVRHGQLVAANPNIRALIDKLSGDAYPDAMVRYIPTEEEAQRVVLLQPTPSLFRRRSLRTVYAKDVEPAAGAPDLFRKRTSTRTLCGMISLSHQFDLRCRLRHPRTATLADWLQEPELATYRCL
jgi:hypothetical protein